MKNYNLLFTLTCLISFSAYSDVNQQVWGQAKDSPYENNKQENTQQSPFIKGNSEMETNAKDTGIDHYNSNSDWTKRNYKGADLSTYQGKNSEIIDFDNKEIIGNLYNKGKSSLMFSYVYDTFDYKDSAGVFESIFQNDSASSFQMGYLTLSYRKNWSGESFKFFWQFNGGVSFNKGTALFTDGEESRTELKIWHIPLSYHLGAKMHFGRYLGLSVSAGPLVSGLLQNRNDREKGASDKDLRQFGYGFSAQAALDLSMSQMFPKYGVELKNDSGVNDMSVSLILKMLSASGFKNEDVEISGVSVGLGVNFDYF